MDCSLPGSSVHGIFQARVLEWLDWSKELMPNFLPNTSKLHLCKKEVKLQPFGIFYLILKDIRCWGQETHMKIREFRENHVGRQNSRKLPKGSVQEEKRKKKGKALQR